MKYGLLICLVLFPFYAYTQRLADGHQEDRDKNIFRICFYNLENFFDCENNPFKEDDDYTPEGTHHWTQTRFEKKAINIAKVFIAIGEWDLPDIIGVCEIENETAIKQLLYHTPLQNGRYEYVYYESPDRRGINTALFYRTDRFKVLKSYPISLTDTTDTTFKTRDILYVEGLPVSSCKDTLHVFINHWTSQYGGYSETVDKRNRAAQIARKKIDSLLALNSAARIVIMGDFNNNPDDESMTVHLRAPYQLKDCRNDDLINMMYPYFRQNNTGTHKYQQEWSILDQMIISPALYKSKHGLGVHGTAVIFSADFLLEKDEVYLGLKPFRTFLGFRYRGGFSDHLPIYLDLQCK
jgi:endonuclease/exonuclease/phosphatase family metal-dependent hydrolase